MKCPGCADEMAIVDLAMVEIDRCPGCGGIVLDKGETEVIDSLGLASLIEGGVPFDGGSRTTQAHCWPCNKDMVTLRAAGDIEYDWCDGCERIFFDRGELSQLEAFVDL
jgi:Zn-finger nucleic acid-binding protein